MEQNKNMLKKCNLWFQALPELERANKALDEAKRREREQMQYIRMLKTREKQIVNNQQKLRNTMTHLGPVNTVSC